VAGCRDSGGLRVFTDNGWSSVDGAVPASDRYCNCAWIVGDPASQADNDDKIGEKDRSVDRIICHKCRKDAEWLVADIILDSVFACCTMHVVDCLVKPSSVFIVSDIDAEGDRPKRLVARLRLRLEPYPELLRKG
jgi:hypothetical protein